mgnify:FL=1
MWDPTLFIWKAAIDSVPHMNPTDVLEWCRMYGRKYNTNYPQRLRLVVGIVFQCIPVIEVAEMELRAEGILTATTMQQVAHVTQSSSVLSFLVERYNESQMRRAGMNEFVLCITLCKKPREGGKLPRSPVAKAARNAPF